MQDHQRQFIELALAEDALRFGEFTLKSGRISPYFFNMGQLHSGETLRQVGQCYAETIETAGLNYDVLFGPAYKGIPLVCATSIALADQYQQNIPYCFNRKETKDHGEGGQLVGADLKQKRVLIIDDVITAGTAMREAMTFIETHAAKLAGMVIALDRQERGQGERSAIQEIIDQYGVPVISIITLDNIIDYLEEKESQDSSAIIEAIDAYRKEYGC